MPYKDPAKERARQKIKYAKYRDRVLARQKAYRIANLEKRREIDRMAQAKYSKTPKGRLNAIKGSYKTWACQDGRYRARQTLSRAVKAGILIKPNRCLVSGEDCQGGIEGHHNDYSKPLQVEWLCRYHHRLIHLEKQN